MKNCLLLSFFILSTFTALSQVDLILISGKVIESQSKVPVEFATITIKDANTDALVNGVTTDENGDFQVESNTPDFQIEISFIGFASQTLTDFQIKNNRLQLGTIVLKEDSQQLDEVVVRAEKSSTEFRLDKRVFNVGKDLSSTGASALEVLNNVPSVNVDIEGVISIRGSSGVQILINGKPSVLASEQGNALGTITAEMIDRIEVITNPSAKYEAEGTSGIINIVIKKDERKGINGSATINTGWPHNHSFGLSLNRRTEKFNIFSQLGVGYRELPNDMENINQNFNLNTTLSSIGEEFRNEFFYNAILGADYHINKNNVLTLSGSFAYEVEDQPSSTTFNEFDQDFNLTSSWNRSEITEATNPKLRYELQYKSKLPGHKEHALLVSALGSFFGKDQSSAFTNQSTFGNRTFSDQQTRTNFQEGKYTFNVDYTKPIRDKIILEFGSQYVLNDVSNDFEVLNEINGEFTTDPDLTNLFEYQQNVLGIYTTAAYEDKKWGLKLGLRLENTDLKTNLVNTNEINETNFNNFFPTLHTSLKLTEAFSLQAGYSRRIFRPRLWDLNPFFNIRNNFAVRTGNPDLLPEYTDSYELGAIHILGKFSYNATVYHRFTTAVIERITSVEDNVSITKPFNIGVNNATGFEVNAKYAVNNKLAFDGEFNYNYFSREGELGDLIFDFANDRWSSELTTKIKFPKDIEFELTGEYESREQTVQGTRSPNLYANLGLRKKILDGKGVFNFSIRDIFASRIRETETFQEDFYVYQFRQRGRFITFGFSYGFGKGEAMEFKGRRRH